MNANKPTLHDSVTLTVDRPDLDLKVGARGVIINAYTSNEFEVEFFAGGYTVGVHTMCSEVLSKATPHVVRVESTDVEVVVTLSDERSVRVPLAQYPRLAQATPAQRANCRLIGGSMGIHWDDLDEDLSLRSFDL